MKKFIINSQQYNIASSGNLEFPFPANLEIVKIVDAILCLQIPSLPDGVTGVKVEYLPESDEPWGHIDLLPSSVQNSVVKINISDELQDAINSNSSALKLKFTAVPDGSVNFLEKQTYSLEVDYISLFEAQENSSGQTLDLGRAGTAGVNLATGQLAIASPLVPSDNCPLPLSVALNYNGSKQYATPENGLKQGFGLNVTQYLIKHTDKDTLYFTYIDANGKEQIIEEKYYYLDGEQKLYVTRDALSVDLDGNYVFEDTDGISRSVLTELEAPSGIKLLSSIEGVKGFENVDYEPEDLINVKANIKNISKTLDSLESNIKSNKNQLLNLVLTKEALLKQLNFQAKNYEISKLNLETDTSIQIKNNADVAIDSSDQSYTNLSNFTYVQDFFAYHKCIPTKYINKILNGDTDIPVTDNASETRCLQAGDITCIKTLIKYRGAYMSGLGLNLQADTTGSIYLQSNSLELTKNLYVDKVPFEEFKALVANYLGEDIIGNSSGVSNTFTTDELKAFILGDEAVSLAQKDLFSVDMQIDSLLKSNEDYAKSYEEYCDQLAKYTHQKEQLEMQVPVHYLYNDDGIVYGYGKVSGNENLFRLILIADSYENMIFISYKSSDDSRIDYITNSAEQKVSFAYDDADRLVSITDTQDRCVKLDFSNADFVKLVHNDGTLSYIYLSNDRPYAVMNQNGLGAKLTYENNRVVRVDKLSALDGVVNGKVNLKAGFDFENLADFDAYKLDKQYVVFNYNNYKSTTVTNGNGKNVTYLFDKLGEARTVYQINNFDSENDDPILVATNPSDYAIDVSDYTYKDNRLTDKVSVLSYSTNYFVDSCFSSSNITIKNALALGSFVCGEDATPYTYEECEKYHTLEEETTVKIDSMTMSESMLENINTRGTLCSHKVFVVSGWAKADSAFIVTDEDPKLYADYLLARKFEMRAVVKYAGNTQETFTKSFDWRNTAWQYCSLPIKLENKAVQSIVCYIDYSNNTGKIEYTDFEFKEGDFETTIYEDKLPVSKESGHSNWKTLYEYEDKLLVKEIHVNKLTLEELSTTYEYNKQGKVVRSTSYNGIVNENVYNDKGLAVKTLTYHVSEPANMLVSEEKLDDKGNVTASVNEFGEQISTNEYVDGTGIVSTVTDMDGNKTSYGYDKNNTLLQTTTTINGEENTNIYGYYLDFLTSLKHNDFDVSYDYDSQGRTTEIKIAKQNYVSKSYGDDEETTTYANGESYRQTFNKDGNVLDTYYQGELICHNSYDTYGNLTSTKSYDAGNTNTKFYFVNKFGNTYKEVDSQHGVNVVTANAYSDDHSNIVSTTMTLGDNSLTYSYDYDNTTPENRLNSITLPNVCKQSVSYDKLGRVSGVKLGDLSKQYSYVKRGNRTSNLISSVKYDLNNSIFDNLKYKYDEKGNITEIRRNNNLLARYFYDSLSRLVREDNKEFGKTYTFVYDGGGNIALKREYAFTLVDNLEYETEIANYPYSYPATGWKDQLLSYNGEPFEYDVLGNPTTFRGKSLEWSHGRRLDKFEDIEFKYNLNGIRTSKIYNGKETKYFLNGSKIISQQDDTNTFYFYYGVDGIAGFNLNGSEYVYKKNAQNDIIGIYDANGIELVRYTYDAWGLQIIEYFDEISKSYFKIENTEYNDNSNAQLAILNPFRYRSYYYDTETNLYYLNSRYYDPTLGRFINADDVNILSETQEDINGLNLYVYCLNNPVNDIDTNGCWSWSRFWKTICVVVVAALVVIAIAAITVASGGSAAVVFAGAGIGMITSGITSTISQLASGNGFSFSQLIVDMAFGAISGAIGGSSFGLIGATIGNTITGFASSVTSDWVAGNEIDWGKAGLTALTSFFTGLLSGSGAQNGITGHTKQLVNSRTTIKNNINLGNYSAKGGQGAMNLINYHIKNSRAMVRSIGMFNLKMGFQNTMLITEISTMLAVLLN